MAEETKESERPKGQHHPIERLRAGNRAYLKQAAEGGAVSAQRIRRLFDEGQRPYAVVVACSDSRVVPEIAFQATIGELFVIRVAGNVIGDIEAASITYACEHLHVDTVVVLGHTHCGAIETAMTDVDHGVGNAVVDAVRRAIGQEKDPYRACGANVIRSVRSLAEWPQIASLMEGGVEVYGAVYHTDSGCVEFIYKA